MTAGVHAGAAEIDQARNAYGLGCADDVATHVQIVSQEVNGLSDIRLDPPDLASRMNDEVGLVLLEISQDRALVAQVQCLATRSQYFKAANTGMLEQIAPDHSPAASQQYSFRAHWMVSQLDYSL